jgi:biopolymer transport protein ExbB
LNLLEIIINGIKQLGEGGFLMIPLLFCSLFAHAIIFERLYNLQKEKLIPSRFISRIYKVLENGNPDMALSLCESRPGPLTNILKTGIINRDLGQKELETIIEFASKPERKQLEKYLRTLEVIGQVAVLIGLLGTVLGLLICFTAVFKSGIRPETTMRIASGVSVALLTTVAGLAVAIPSMIAHSYFISKVDSMLNDMNRHSISIIKFLTKGKDWLVEHEAEKSEDD